MRPTSPAFLISLCVLAISMMPGPSHAYWPRFVCGWDEQQGIPWPLVSLVPDTSSGVFVVTQSGCLASHLDAAGSTKANWPAVLAPQPTRWMWAIADDAGGVIAVRLIDPSWPPTGIGKLYATRWTAAGDVHPLWLQSQLLLSPSVMHPAGAPNVFVCPDGKGGLFAAWLDRQAQDMLWVQRAGPSGETASPGGVVLAAGAGTRSLSSLVADGAGGAIAVWHDRRDSAATGYDVYAQRVDSNLVTQWPDNGLAVCALPWDQTAPVAVPDGSGGALVFWADDRNDGGTPGSPLPNIDIYGQHVLAVGTFDPAWDASGVAVTTAAGNQGAPMAVGDGAGGAFVAWSGGSGPTPATVQRMTGPGVPAPGWPAGGLAASGTSTSGGLTRISPGAGGSVYLVWNQGSGTYQLNAICIQADASVAPGWPTGGAVLHPGSAFPFVYPRCQAVATDSQGQLYALWDEGSFGLVSYHHSTVLTHYRPDGAVPTLASLADASAGPDRVRLRWFAGGAPVVAAMVERSDDVTGWSDLAAPALDGLGYYTLEDRDVVPGHRYGYRLRYLSATGTAWTGPTWLTVPAALRLTLSGLLPNPGGGGALLAFTLPSPGAARLELFDVAGRSVWSREVGDLGAGSHRLPLDSALRSGVYRARLVSGGQTRQAAITIVR